MDLLLFYTSVLSCFILSIKVPCLVTKRFFVTHLRHLSLAEIEIVRLVKSCKRRHVGRVCTKDSALSAGKVFGSLRWCLDHRFRFLLPFLTKEIGNPGMVCLKKTNGRQIKVGFFAVVAGKYLSNVPAVAKAIASSHLDLSLKLLVPNLRPSVPCGPLSRNYIGHKHITVSDFTSSI